MWPQGTHHASQLASGMPSPLAGEALAPQRVLGGAGLLLVILVLLSLPLLVALRSAARRRAARTQRADTPVPDAWAESARRMKGPA